MDETPSHHDGMCLVEQPVVFFFDDAPVPENVQDPSRRILEDDGGVAFVSEAFFTEYLPSEEGEWVYTHRGESEHPFGRGHAVVGWFIVPDRVREVDQVDENLQEGWFVGIPPVSRHGVCECPRMTSCDCGEYGTRCLFCEREVDVHVFGCVSRRSEGGPRTMNRR